ncbi:MAG: hypothetical protein II117_00030 [Clostridia bacterium]|nr:hypothetical protein [Clostridia bacterium]
MKRFLTVLLALLLAGSVFACGSGDRTNRSSEGGSAQAETPSAFSPAPTEMPLPSEAPAIPFTPGTYGAVSYTVGDVTLAGDSLVSSGLSDAYLVLNGDHTGLFHASGLTYAIGWSDDGVVTVSDIPYYTMQYVDAETLGFRIGDAVYTMKLGAAVHSPEAASGSVETPAPAETGEAEAQLFPGAPHGDGDGVLDRETLAGLYRWLTEMDPDFRQSLTFDEISAAAGKAGHDNQNNNGKAHSAVWSDGDQAILTVTFREQNGLWSLGSIVIVGMTSDEYDAADVSGFPKVGSGAPAGSNPTKQITLTENIGDSDAKLGISIDLPTAHWFLQDRSDSVRIYCAPNELNAPSSLSYMIIEGVASAEAINRNESGFENLREIDSRAIDSIIMKGRSYRCGGMDWTEYYGELKEGVWISIRMTGVDFSEGTETEAIVSSLSFQVR